MTAADWVIVAVIIVSVIQAAISGFFHEAFGIAGLVFGYLLAAWNYQRLAARFAPHLKSMWLGEIAAFLIIFLAVLLLAGIAGRIARYIVKEAGLSSVDRVLGGALGLLRGSLMVAVILMSMAAFTPASTWLEGSELAPYFLVVGRAAIWVAPSELRARFYQGLELLHREQQHM
ncbi:MAG TPA: CvpA family protein [Terriglobales bacterium]|jgi:membrane protein required for colicin V production|nr:CvpA family protein [Terriglobales bacterium]